MEALAALPAASWWLIAGALLLIVESVLPGVFLLWFGFAALLLGAVLLYMPLTLIQQMLLFSVLSVVMIIFVRSTSNYGRAPRDNSTLNLRGQRYVGSEVLVAEAISSGRGKVQIGDTLWSVTGPDCAIGTRVRVVATDGTVLRVERIA